MCRNIRLLLNFDPPTTDEGQWIIERYAPWLEPGYPNPAEQGELRWYAMLDGAETECIDGTPFKHSGETVRPRSRTFIRSLVTDNPIYMATGYRDTLAALPEPLRSQMMLGNFGLDRKDDPWQLIPTEWWDAAVSRWTPDPPGPLDAIGGDVARGGEDQACLVNRHGTWIAMPERHPGISITTGGQFAALIVKSYRKGAVANIDILGVGAAVEDVLRDSYIAYNPVGFGEGTDMLDRSGRLCFLNVRAAAYWLARECLDPANGMRLAVPPDKDLRRAMLAHRWETRPPREGHITVKVREKEEVRRIISRSPDDADAFVLALWGIHSSVPMEIYTTAPRETHSILRGYFQ